jgi:hypothetical protein
MVAFLSVHNDEWAGIMCFYWGVFGLGDESRARLDPCILCCCLNTFLSL